MIKNYGSSYKNNIQLENNGRIFPLWVMQNFKDFVLPAIIRKEGEDPCNVKLVEELTLYQKFIGAYLDYRSPFKDLLVYHGLGSGKTVTTINVYNILYNYTPKWNIFLIIPAALKHDPWIKDIKKWLLKENYDNRFSNFIFIHYDSPFADRDFLENINKADNSKPFLYIIEECHRFINNVYNNIVSKKGKRAQIIYDYIQQEKKDNSKNTRIMLLSATPAVNNAFELALIFNLLRPGSFPNSESMFNQIFVSSGNYTSLNELHKNMLQRRIIGLVSYYLGATPDKYATKFTHYKNIIMNPYYEEVYNYFENIEEEKNKISRTMRRGKVTNEISTYSSYTRQACNFVFPIINEDINGEKRPRPSTFKIKEDLNLSLYEESKYEEKKKLLIKTNNELALYINSIKKFINALINFFKDIHRKDKINNYTLQDDIKLFISKYNSSFTKFLEEKKKSKLFEALNTYSPKMVMIIFNILKSKGPVLVYSNYVEMEGLQILKIYLSFFGFTDYSSSDTGHEYFKYIEYHGSIEKHQRELNKSIFNDSANLYGKIIKIIMISPAGAEGINLYNIRQVHILEPYWNEVRIEQVVGRAVRQCHHAALPMEERRVDIYRYKMVRKNHKETTDERMESISRRKNNLLLSFLEAIKEVAIDCELFKNHNMIGTQYRCFKFNEESLLEEHVGPAYNEKIENDQKLNNGLNAVDSIIKKIKVRKITAVYIKSDKLYSEPKFYWYYDESHVIYDYELNYPIGKIALDTDLNPIKINNDTYLIDTIITIPEFKLY